MPLALASFKSSISLHAIDLVSSNRVENNIDGNCYDYWQINVNELQKSLVFDVIARNNASLFSYLIVEIFMNKFKVVKNENNKSQ